MLACTTQFGGMSVACGHVPFGSYSSMSARAVVASARITSDERATRRTRGRCMVPSFFSYAAERLPSVESGTASRDPNRRLEIEALAGSQGKCHESLPTLRASDELVALRETGRDPLRGGSGRGARPRWDRRSADHRSVARP